ncbi:gliding motility-associated C-terminal domain-containing protein [Dyadobacter flavalbus]|uniref:Gliding motility-associated C-terminal domain-containing protein n=1 Tax=Dyadobacter flavalbus TaxID=2579942 RepID=A0A5M8QXR5_9BACT|nr:gliding motility-associated C-terminal domain-containing protein [Dyadobacter flavalbus]KAA6440181.1 gliding motility-associated C-terminal domain-containing protein [Dyadobacter flavalbus]
MKIRLLLFFLFGIFTLFQNEVSGQNCGTTGGFSISAAQGCAPLTISVQNEVAGAENISYAFNFDRSKGSPDAGDVTQDSSYVYTSPGTYTILQFGSANGTGFSQCQDIEVLETRAPRANLIKCPDGKAQLSIINDSISKSYDFIEVNWGDGSKESVTLTGSNNVVINHSYPNGNIPDIIVSGRYNSGQCQQNSVSTTFTGPFVPQPLTEVGIRTVEMLASGEAKIIYDGMEGVPTEILMDGGNGQFVPTGKTSQSAGSHSVTIGNLNPAQIYRFRLSSTDICGNTIESPIVSSMLLKEGDFSLDEIISVSWEHLTFSGNVLQYQLVRNGTVVFVTSDQLSYLDTDVKCGTLYEYVIVAVVSDDVRSYSAPVSLQPKTVAPEVINTASVTVKDEKTISTQVELTGEGLTSTYDLIVERALLGSTDFQQVSPLDNQSLQFEDSGVNTNESSYCYRFIYENACNVRGPDYSSPVCSIFLENSTSRISWNGNSPFTQGISSYDLVQTDAATGNVLDEIPKQLETSHTLDLEAQSAFSFQVKANSASGNLVSYSNVLNFSQNAILLIPDAFTPNGDAYNERFEVKAYFVTDFSMSVFNRWGEVIFHSRNAAEGWDGNTSGGKAPAGYYLYKIDLTDSAGKEVRKEGSFLLIR